MTKSWLVVAVSTLLAACGTGQDEKDRAAMNPIPMQALCVGRMLVDMPKSAQVTWDQQFDYAKITRLLSTVNSKEAFTALVDKRNAELQVPTYANPKGPLGIYKAVGDTAVIMMFRDPDVAGVGYYTERYLWTGHWGYKYETDPLSDKEANDLIPDIETSFAKIQPMVDRGIPTGAGFCIDGAMVTGTTGFIQVAPSAAVPIWEGVAVNAGATEDDGSRQPLSWESKNLTLNADTPYENLAAYEKTAAENAKTPDKDRPVKFDVLRKRERRLAGLSGQETAFKETLANGQVYYRFDWEGGFQGSGFSSRNGFVLGLSAGSDQYTSEYVAPPAQDDLLALWDAMLDSLKPRPGAR